MVFSLIMSFAKDSRINILDIFLRGNMEVWHPVNSIETVYVTGCDRLAVT